VERALAILRAFDADHPELGVSELARRLNLSKSIVMRLVATLRDGGFLERDRRSDKYRVGLAAFEVGSLYALRVSMVEAAEPLLRQLAEQLGLSAYLSTLSDGRVVYVLVVEGTGPIRVGPRIGSSVPAHTTAAGKALLAHLPPDELAHVLTTCELVAETPASITSREVLLDELRQVRAQGYAVNRGEHLAGVGAVGAPIFEPGGRALAAVAVAYPLYLVPQEQWPAIARAVMDTARQISRRLGIQAHGAREPAGRPGGHA
jgi:DNA-binding IclR family transcriptional regulator